MSSERPGKLYLVPNTIGGDVGSAVPPANIDVVKRLRYWIAENPKNAREFLKRIGTSSDLQSIRIERLDKNTRPAMLPDLLGPLLSGSDAGLLSEAGCPAIADPGAVLVRLAHTRSVRVIPLVGPSSIILALMASGLEGQRFAFHGYLPVGEAALLPKLRQLEESSSRNDSTQIFIETPYRNQRLLSCLVQTLAADTTLCMASDLTCPTEEITTKTVGAWKRMGVPPIGGRPTVFLLLARSPRPANAPSSNREPRSSKGR